MTKSSVLVLLAALTATFAYHLQDHHESKKDYNFDYTVHDPHTHDYHSHQESSKDGVVKGYYSVKDADGSLREVHYTADPKTGFKAIVTKNGVQVQPHTSSKGEHHEAEEHHHQEEHHHEEEHHHQEEHHHEELQHLPEYHHEELEHHVPEHHEALVHHEHIPEHHEHAFAVGLSSFHGHQHYHHEEPQHFHHF